MDKRRLTRMLDILFALAMLSLIKDNIGIPFPRDSEGFWRMHREVFRVAASELWLLGLWLNCYRAWDRAGKLTRGALFCGAGLLLCVLATPWLTELIIVSYIARISQYLYGGCMLLSAAFSWLMFRCLNRANGGDADGARANAAHRKALLGAMGILAAGIVLCAVRFRQAVWYSVVVAGVWLLVTAAIQAREA